MANYVKDLILRYRSLERDFPKWAYRLPSKSSPLPPSIPFVGQDYPRWGGILVYASAENLSHYERGETKIPKYLKSSSDVWNRHRAAYVEWVKRRKYGTLERNQSPDFPDVHMAPFSDGSLLVATAYYLIKCSRHPSDMPVNFLESIAAANFCKFSIRTSGKQNQDYASSPAKVLHSLPYVCYDLLILKPSTIILPRSIFQCCRHVAPILRACAPQKAQFVQLRQFNSRVVNIHLKNNQRHVFRLKERLKKHPISKWIDNLKGYTPGHPYRFLAEIDKLLPCSNSFP
jgi:hypothetical protein